MLYRRMINKVKSTHRKKEKIILIHKPALSDCIILWNNCLAEFLCDDYGMQFNSPTINLQMPPEYFLKFCKDLD